MTMGLLTRNPLMPQAKLVVKEGCYWYGVGKYPFTYLDEFPLPPVSLEELPQWIREVEELVSDRSGGHKCTCEHLTINNSSDFPAYIHMSGNGWSLKFKEIKDDE